MNLEKKRGAQNTLKNLLQMIRKLHIRQILECIREFYGALFKECKQTTVADINFFWITSIFENPLKIAKLCGEDLTEKDLYNSPKTKLTKSKIAGLAVLKEVQVAVCGMHCIVLNNNTFKILGNNFSKTKNWKRKKKRL